MGASRRRIRLGRKMSLMLGALLIAMLALTWTASAASTKSISGYSSCKSLAGVTVIKHWSTTTFGYNGDYLKDPHGFPRNDAWTFPGTTEPGSSSGGASMATRITAPACRQRARSS